MRKNARTAAFQVLFAWDTMGAVSDETRRMVEEELSLTERDNGYVDTVLALYAEHAEDIDEAIRTHLNVKWTLKRLGGVERAVLRLGALEILYLTDVPRAVAIDEALELTKEYGEETSSALVNGVLDKIF